MQQIEVELIFFHIQLVDFALSNQNVIVKCKMFRYIVIVHPMRSRALCTSSNCRRALLLVWSLSLLLALPVAYTNVS